MSANFIVEESGKPIASKIVRAIEKKEACSLKFNL
jgi:hypothetical protein